MGNVGLHVPNLEEEIAFVPDTRASVDSWKEKLTASRFPEPMTVEEFRRTAGARA